ncbi:MAG: transposase [Bacteroidetes bacterium CG2_30_32_10]|nr:MAG: transposase [Bacteroidetes bacterium CG2_30_32_10]
MSDKYKIRDKEKAYFITMTVIGWIDAFTRVNHKLTIIESLKYCQKEKGLAIYGYCIMPSHIHMIARAEGEFTLSEIIRDFKKYTAKAIIKQIQEEPESRREWMLNYFEEKGKDLARIKQYKFWQDGNQAKEIFSNSFFQEKLDYIHKNPVEELIVENREDYLFSSARNYAGLSNYLDIILESVKLNAL